MFRGTSADAGGRAGSLRDDALSRRVSSITMRWFPVTDRVGPFQHAANIGAFVAWCDCAAV